MNCKRLLSAIFFLLCIVMGGRLANGADFFVDVDINGFHPSTEFITVGDTVTWTSQDNEFHDVVSDRNKWATGYLLNMGDTFTLIFNQAGSYPYHSDFDGTIGNIIVTAAVASNSPPSVTITNPINGAIFDAPATVVIAADATDDGSIAGVQFFVGTNSAGISSTAPYSVTTNLLAGNYTLTAVATDNSGLPATSAPVNIVVQQSSHPPITLSAPAFSGGQFTLAIDGLVSGRTNLIQFSATLTNWTSIATNVAGGSSANFTDPNVAVPFRLYRVVELP